MFESVARADFDLVVAFLALDEAAPVELALAPLHSLLPSGRVAAVATHQLAPVDAGTSLKLKNKTKINSKFFISLKLIIPSNALNHLLCFGTEQ